MNSLFAEHEIQVIPDDPFPEITRWVQLKRTRLPYWPERTGPLPDYEAWNEIQARSVHSVISLWESGTQTIVGCGVTGFGKTRCAEKLIRFWNANRESWLFSTHRKMLFADVHKRFMLAGLEHGCRAAGYADHEKPDALGQIAMIPSERAAVKTAKSRQFHSANNLIMDEAHANASGYAKEMFDYYAVNEARILLLTATPVNLGAHNAKLVYFGRPSEMMGINAIVPAEIEAPDEVDLKDVKRMPNGEFSSGEMSKRFMIQQVVGSIVDHLLASNPQLRPSLLFAPDVESSMWFVDELIRSGISACSIDGESVYFGQKDADGERIVYRSNSRMRDHAATLHRLGIISVVCNRFVFVMGVDWPWIEHLIFATALGSTHTWIQACGRGLRSYVPSRKSRCFIQDHGGNWWRHPNPNLDIEWNLDDTPKEAEKKRDEKIISGKEHEDMRCPRCKMTQPHALWVGSQGKCSFCGFSYPKSERMVFQTDGRLKKVTGPVRKQKKSSKASSAQKTWEQHLFPVKQSKSDRPMNWRQLLAWFTRENGERLTIRDVNGEFKIHDRASGEEHRLAWIPAPNSPVWDKIVRETDFSELQKPERINKMAIS